MSYSITTLKEVKDKIWDVIHKTPAFDIHTNLYDTRFELSFIKTGIDELLTTQELTDELFRYSPHSISNPNQELTREEFSSLPLRIKSELVWHRLFLANTPLSETTRSVLTALGLLQLDPKTRNLGAYRNFFSNSSLQTHINLILKLANLEGLVTCYNPLLPSVIEKINKTKAEDKFYTALDFSAIICNWKKNYELLGKQGYPIKRSLDKNVYPIILNYLLDLINETNAVYLHLNLPSEISFSNKSNNIIKLLTKCLIPALIKTHKPLSIWFNETKSAPTLNSLKMNESLQFSNIDFIQELSSKFPDLKLLITDSNYENQYGLTLLAKKNHNIMPMNGSTHLSAQSSFTEISRMHFDQLGTSFIAHTSSADVYEELLPEWAHSRWMLGELLQEKYSNLYRTGWRVTEQEIEREVYNLLSGNAKKFININ